MPNNSILQAVLDEYDDQSLDHYGVKGMRWGHRKRKVSSGSRSRSNSSTRSNQRKSRREMKRNRRTLSEADLNRNLDRLRKEKQLKELIDEDVNPGKKYIQDVLKKSGDKLLPAALAAGGAYALAQVMDVKMSKGDIFNLAVPAPKNKWSQYSEPLKNAVGAVQKAKKEGEK